MNAGPFAAIVLAGGFSSRMGGFKPLLPIGEKTVVEHLISTFRTNGVEVFLVTGHRAKDLAAAVGGQAVHIVENPYFQEGMFSSVQAGIRALTGGFAGTFVAPVDIPLVRPFTIGRLIEAASDRPERIVYPFFAGRRGHPPLIPSRLLPRILGWPRESDLKSALEEAQGEAVEIAVADRFIHSDLDNPTDYQRLLGEYQAYGIPSEEECRAVVENIYPLTEGLLRHCRKVSEVAMRIVAGLAQNGHDLDGGAVRAGALWHDLAKGQPEHEKVGAEIVRRLGFAQIAPLIAEHTDPAVDDPVLSLEAKVVFLADKLVAGDRLTSLSQRFGAAMERFGAEPSAAQNIRRKWAGAAAVQKEIEGLLGSPVESLFSE
jgi:molybdenum cofactor cytidylyltransferase